MQHPSTPELPALACTYECAAAQPLCHFARVWVRACGWAAAANGDGAVRRRVAV